MWARWAESSGWSIKPGLSPYDPLCSDPAAVPLSQAHPKGTMAFAGKYEFEGDENYDAFVQKIGESGWVGRRAWIG